MNGCLETRGLCVRLGGKEVLRGLDLEVRRGEFLALLGANGSGKTTLLHCLGRLRKPEAGQVLWKGAPIRSLGTRDLARQLAILPQSPHAPFSLEVGALVAMGRSPYRRFAWQQDQEGPQAIAEALAHMELQELASRPMGSLSGGERQRAWIAMAMAQNPEVLLLDEPTTFLDVSHQLQVLEMLCRWKERQERTVVAVLHDLNLALRYADRIAVLHEGVIHELAPASHALEEASLRTVFGIEAAYTMDASSGRRFLIPHLPGI